VLPKEHGQFTSEKAAAPYGVAGFSGVNLGGDIGITYVALRQRILTKLHTDGFHWIFERTSETGSSSGTLH
jgi:hypothetical protein